MSETDYPPNVAEMPFPEDRDMERIKMAPHSIEAEQSVLGGLLLCLLGDLLLMPDSPAGFLAGLFAFLCGHLLYGIAFLQLPHNTTALAVSCVPALLLAAASVVGGSTLPSMAPKGILCLGILILLLFLAAAATLPIAAALAGREMAPLLAPPARSFLVAVAAALLLFLALLLVWAEGRIRRRAALNTPHGRRRVHRHRVVDEPLPPIAGRFGAQRVLRLAHVRVVGESRQVPDRHPHHNASKL